MSTRFETFMGSPMSVFFETDEFDDTEFAAEEFEGEGFVSEEDEEVRRRRRAAARGKSSQSGARSSRRRRMSPAEAAKRRKQQMMNARKRRPTGRPKRFPIIGSGVTLLPGVFSQSSAGPLGGPPEGDKSQGQQGSEFNRWVQTSLSKILGLNLPVDGVIDVQTRSAIRSFQTKQGLPADGIVGPPTERAITEALSLSAQSAAAGASASAGADTGAEPGAGAGGEPPAGASQEPGAAAGPEPSGAGADEPAKDSELYEYFAQGEFPDYESGMRHRQRRMNRRRDQKEGKCNCQHKRSGSAEFSGYAGEYVDEGEFGGYAGEYLDEGEFFGEDEAEFFEDEGEFFGADEAEFLGEDEGEFYGEDEGEFMGEEEFSFSGWPSKVFSMFRGGVSSPSAAGTPSYVPAGPPVTSKPVTYTPVLDTGGLDIVTTRSGIQVARQIAAQVDALIAAAQADGIKLSGGGFRSPQKQIELRKKNCGPTHFDIYQKKSSLCTPPTAIPGQSNHERGLAIDFTYNGDGIKTHSNPGFKWLAANAARFGLHNLPSEPWHWSVNGK